MAFNYRGEVTKSIYPCLWFDNEASAAATFYSSVFGNSKIISENSRVVLFEVYGLKIMGLNGGPAYRINPSVSFTVYCESDGETDRIWNSLTEGSSALIPLGKYPWSEKYGWLQDRFGLSWQISVAGGINRGKRILPSMLFTGSRFGKAEEAIRFYSGIFENSSTEVMVLYPENDPNAGKVMYSEFSLNHYPLIAMDGPGEHAFSFNEGVSLVVECDKQEEIDYFWAKLNEGGEEGMCGWLRDRFGVSWQVVPSILQELLNDPEKAPEVIREFSQMKKYDIKKLLN